MLCENCGENEVNFKYTQIINGVKKEISLCDKCAKTLGLQSFEFDMPLNVSTLLGNFFGEEIETEHLPTFSKTNSLKCDKCGMAYDEFIQLGKFGCDNCYNVFSNGLNGVLKNMQGANKHIGRKGRINPDNEKVSQNNISNLKKNKEEDKLTKLNNDLKLAIKEERYEDAAKIRDEIKKISN